MVISNLARTFRLGTTSFVLPDHVLPNVEWLAGKVDDVQLLLIEPDGDLPGPADIARMKEIERLYGLSYSVHLPTLNVVDPTEGLTTVGAIAGVIELAAPIDPSGWVIHIDPGPPVSESDLEHWIDQASASLRRLVSEAGIPMERLEVENQEAADVPAHLRLANATGCSFCLDLGHVLHAGGDPLSVLEECLPMTPHLHLHGVAERDHCSLEHYPALDSLLHRLLKAEYSGLLTIEVFGKEPFERSLVAVSRAWPGAV